MSREEIELLARIQLLTLRHQDVVDELVNLKRDIGYLRIGFLFYTVALLILLLI